MSEEQRHKMGEKLDERERDFIKKMDKVAANLQKVIQ